MDGRITDRQHCIKFLDRIFENRKGLLRQLLLFCRIFDGEQTVGQDIFVGINLCCTVNTAYEQGSQDEGLHETCVNNKLLLFFVQSPAHDLSSDYTLEKAKRSI